jgi:hypothetical protein
MCGVAKPSYPHSAVCKPGRFANEQNNELPPFAALAAMWETPVHCCLIYLLPKSMSIGKVHGWLNLSQDNVQDVTLEMEVSRVIV